MMMTGETSDRQMEEIVRRHADTVYRLALVHMKNTQDAEDIFQEVFLRLVKNLDKLENDEHIKAWLIRVTINCCKSQFTRAYRRHETPQEQEILQEQAGAAEEPDTEEHIVYETVQKLPDKYRTVIHLFYFEELSIREIGEVLKKRESTIKSQLSRGREKLKQLLEKEGITDAAGL